MGETDTLPHYTALNAYFSAITGAPSTANDDDIALDRQLLNLQLPPHTL